MNQIVTGAIAMGFAVAAIYFLKFWKQTRDRLFGLFALSFLVLAVNRLVLAIQEANPIGGDHYYLIRLLAFAAILLAIIDKNRTRPANQ